MIVGVNLREYGKLWWDKEWDSSGLSKLLFYQAKYTVFEKTGTETS